MNSPRSTRCRSSVPVPITSRTDFRDASTHASARTGPARHRLTGLRPAWIALALLAISLVATPAAAQGDCDYPDDWDDSGWFRRCIQELTGWMLGHRSCCTLPPS